jgi:acetyl/propionyl-CoA carboxylase alpha subunit
LQALMPVKAPPDLSKYLLSPMPGLLTKVAVQVGQEVKAGEELAVIEAMKMENVLRADHDAKVAKIHGGARRQSGRGSGHHRVRVIGRAADLIKGGRAPSRH